MSKMSSTKNSSVLKQIGKVFLKLFLAFLIISPIVLFFVVSPLFYLNDSPEKKPWISWFDDPQERVYVSWETESTTQGQVEYGTDASNLNQIKLETTGKTIHHVILDGLSPDTKYYYQVRINGELFGAGQFKTAPNDFSSIKFGMISDTQQNVGPGHHYKVAQAIKDKEWAFLANVGDIVEEGNDKRYYDNFFKISADYMDTIPFVPVKGNHDSRRHSLFENYFINQDNLSHDQFYYSFDYGPVHIQVCDFPYGHAPELTPTQMRWIEQDLQDAQDMPFIIVMFHCPVIGASFFGRSEALEAEVRPLLEKYNVDLVVSGHEHHYERGHMNDVTYLILGGGGGMLDPGLRPMPETDFLTQGPCYTEVSVNTQQMSMMTFTPQHELIDQYTIHVNGGAS